MESNSEATIACFSSKITYRKDGDKLRGEGKVYFGGEQSFVFPLSEISSEPIVHRGRHEYFKSGVHMFIWGALGAFVLPRLSLAESDQTLIALPISLAIGGLIAMIKLRRKIETLTFVNHTGVALFSLSRNEGSSEEVDRVFGWIRESAGQTENNGEQNGAG